ncbi:putative spry domain-containing protein [Diaporthe ampelina]|uniref:Putative spry domain-containing protein n=1 Tax=Diaporthe ampelina TaxID=1214573 RepID=A0A0G2FAN6_9PEZI|nr:putative spry domain-containing protein [Diaporthe ampelina]
MGFSSLKSNNPFRHSSNNDSVDGVPPPAGPPPSYAGAGSGPGHGDYAPPPGPPPSYGQHQQGRDDYAPPPGPPPSQQHGKADDDYAPPPGPPPPPPPPQQQQQQQHNWQEAVPDTSGFPPPPDIFSGWDHSPATNASEDQAEAGEAWCRRYPLTPPLDLSREPGLRSRGIVPRLVTPPAGVFGASGSSLAQSASASGAGSWTVSSHRRGGDCCIIGYPHAYLVQRDSPLATGTPATVYFECYVRDLGRDAGFALGFTALPYPPFRMPGWHRGSLAVHGDDGHKFVNDRWGGKDFTAPFKKGEVVGIGMTFSPGAGAAPSSSEKKGSGGGAGAGTVIETEVFFTRNGKLDGRWNLHESLDAQTDLPVTGLEGYHDLAVAVGTFGQVGAEVVLDPRGWAYKPY